MGNDSLVMMLGIGIIWYVVFLFSTVCHEAAHALAALRLGDRTGYLGGQVTLDPTPHIQREPVGTVLIPLVTLLLNQGQWLFGWASCPYDPYWAARYPKRAALMALAGPVANLVLVIIAMVLIHLGLATGFFVVPEIAQFSRVTQPAVVGATAPAIFVSILFSLNLLLCVFNLFPVPPLDGSSIIQLFLSNRDAVQFQMTMRQPVFQMVGLIIAWQLFPAVFLPVFRFSVRLLYVAYL